MKKWFWGVLLSLSVTAALQGQSRDSVLKAIQQTSKWSPADQPTQYDDKNLERLAGKRAAALEHYGFTGATTQNWTGTGGTVRLTFYEMSDGAAARFPASRSRFLSSYWVGSSAGDHFEVC